MQTNIDGHNWTHTKRNADVSNLKHSKFKIFPGPWHQISITFQALEEGGKQNFQELSRRRGNHDCWTQMLQFLSRNIKSQFSEPSVDSVNCKRFARTCRCVGFPLKNLVLMALCGGENFGLMNTQPCAIASSGAGPSYGKPSPINSWHVQTLSPPSSSSSAEIYMNLYFKT